MKPGKDIQDHVASFQRGEESGFTYFFNSLYPSLLYYAFRFLKDKQTAEDVVEDSFVKIWERHKSFTHHLVIKSWMYTTVRNGALSKLRNLQQEEGYKDEVAHQNQHHHERSPINNIIITEVITEVHNSLKELAPGYRIVMQMHYIQGKTVREIAEELNLSISTVKSQKARGLEILRKNFPQLTSDEVLEALHFFH